MSWREIQASYNETLKLQGSNLQMALTFLERDKALRAMFASSDRAQMQKQLAPLFEKLKKEFQVIHFYLLDANRVTLICGCISLVVLAIALSASPPAKQSVPGRL